MKNLFLSVLFLVIFSCQIVVHGHKIRASQAIFPWLVRIDSVYLKSSHNEQYKKEKITVSGTGLLIKFDDNFFVLTNSHLTHGESLKMTLLSTGETLNRARTSSLKMSTAIDLDFISIENPKEQNNNYFTWDKSHLVFLWNIPKHLNFDDLSDKDAFFVNNDKENLMFSPIPAWVNQNPIVLKRPKTESAFTNEIWHQKNFWYDWGKSELMVDGKISPGMSGSPLLYYNKDLKLLAVKGVARSFHKHFPRSYFISHYFINDLIQNRQLHLKMSQSSPENDFIKWHFHNDIGFYRTFGNESSELNWDTSHAGSIDLQQAGGEDTVDGGGEDTADGGIDKKAGDNLPTKDPRSQSNTVNLLSLKMGMLINNKSVLGLTFNKKKPTEEDNLNKQIADNISKNFSSLFTVYADLSMFPFSSLISNFFSKTSFLESMPLSTLFDIKSNYAEQYQTINGSESDNYPCLIDKNSINNNSIRIRIVRYYDNLKKFYFFDLDRKSVLLSQDASKFERYIKLDHDKNPFIIDLRGLFFVVITDLRSPLEPLETISISLKDNQHSPSSYYAHFPYIYYQRAPNAPAVPSFCKIISDSKIFGANN